MTCTYQTLMVKCNLMNTFPQNWNSKVMIIAKDLRFKRKTEVIEMITNNINGGLKGSNDDSTYSFFYVNRIAQNIGYTYNEFMEMSGGSAVGAVYPPDYHKH